MDRKFQRTCYWIAAVALGLYLLFALIYLDLPGLEYDENIFVDAALGNVNGTFVEWHLPLGPFDIPIMIMRYIGAVKSYLYAPIFAVFGTSVHTVRVPAVLLGLLTLGLTYLTVKAMLGRWVALLCFILLATDPSFIFSNKLDWGPVALAMALRMASLYLLWRWLNNGRLRILGLACFLLGVGLFNKIVFAWFIGALALAFPLCFRARIRKRLTAGAVLLALACFLAGCAPLIAYNIRFPLLTFKGQKMITSSWSEGLIYRYNLFRNTLGGSEILYFINEQTPEELAETYRRPAEDGMDSVFTAILRWFPLQRSLTAHALVLALGLIVVLLLRRNLVERECVLFFLSLLLIIVAFICLTAQATGLHHVIEVYPFVHILISYATCEAMRRARSLRAPTARNLAGGGLGAVIGLVAITPLVVDVGYIKAFKVRGGAGRWSDAIYRLADYSKRNPGRHMLIMDWGFDVQLVVLGRDRIHLEEAFVRALESDSESGKMQAIYPYLISPDNLFVFHMPRFETFPMLDLFRRSIVHYGLDARVVAPFFQRDRAPIYVVCEAVHPELEEYRKQGNYFYFREAERYDSHSGGKVDFKTAASNMYALGDYWGQNASDSVIYRFHADKDVHEMRLAIRYASEAHGLLRYGVELDRNRVGTLELEPTGGFGFKAQDWRIGTIKLGEVTSGRHELRIHALEASHPVDLDFFYMAESDFQFAPPSSRPTSEVDLSGISLQYEVLGFEQRPEVRLEVNSQELVAGQGALRLHVFNLNTRGIDLLYTLDGKYMPIIRSWQLNESGTASVFVGDKTPRGLYVYKAIRDSSDASPTGWIRVDVSVRVK